METNTHLTKTSFLAIFIGLMACCPNLSAQSTSICTGCASGIYANSYWPLAVGNSWTYQSPWSNTIPAQAGAAYIVNENSEMDSAQVNGGEIDFKFQNNSPLSFQGVINPVFWKFLPANPSEGQSWNAQVGANVSVVCNIININANISTGLCNYSNCLEVTYNYTFTNAGVSGTVFWTDYFAKGIGPVYTTESINGATATTYELATTQLNGCTATGIDNIGQSNTALNIYPNPADWYAKIKLSVPGNYEVSLVNSMGQEIQRIQTAETTSFETQGLASGIYFVKVIDKTNDTELARSRFIVAH